jgi:positive regulator of sigma E activity
MESEIGKVIATRAGHARVEVAQSGICSHCEMASSCMQVAGGARIIEVNDPLGVSVDQHVRIELTSGGLVGASFLAYMVPLFGMLLGVILGFYVPGSRNELWGGLGALLGLAIGVLASRLVGDWFGRHGKLTPTITAVVTDGERKEHDDAD